MPITSVLLPVLFDKVQCVASARHLFCGALSLLADDCNVSIGLRQTRSAIRMSRLPVAFATPQAHRGTHLATALSTRKKGVRKKSNMSKDQSKTTVVVRDTQAGAAEDLRTPLAAIEDRELLATLNSKEASTQLCSAQPPHFVIEDKGLGTLPVLRWFHHFVLLDVTAWSVFPTEAETLCLLHAGVGGIVRSTVDLESILGGLPNGRLRAVPRLLRFGVAGALPTTRADPTRALGGRSGGTGFKNRAIALELGIRCGAANIHVKHIFEKNCPMRAS